MSIVKFEASGHRWIKATIHFTKYWTHKMDERVSKTPILILESVTYRHFSKMSSGGSTTTSMAVTLILCYYQKEKDVYVLNSSSTKGR
jgi:hypothetical protein